MRHASTILRAAALAALFAPALAQAHPGHAHDASFAAGALHPLSGVEHLLLLFVAGALAARLSTLVLRVLGALFIGALGASASAHLGTDSGAWTFIAGFLFTSTSLVAATATAIKLATRQLTAASRRSPT